MRLPIATDEARAALLCWYITLKLGCQPDHRLLLVGLPQGRLISAELGTDPDGSPFIDAVFRDSSGQLRNPRRFEVPAYFLFRWLMMPGTAARIDGNTPRHHTLEVHDHVLWKRIVANAPAGYIVREKDDHHDLRRRNLYVETVQHAGLELKPAHKGREAAVQASIERLCKLRDEHGIVLIDEALYREVLEVMFHILDAFGLAEPSNRKDAAE